VSAGFTEGFYSKPRIDEELLSKHTEGLIALSACLSGEVPKALLRNDYEQAKAAAIRYNEMFGQGNYYLEIQNHGLNEEQFVMPQIIRISLILIGYLLYLYTVYNISFCFSREKTNIPDKKKESGRCPTLSINYFL
jgi:DNA polymerase III alpha subunit